jgi:hypothetical protein
MSIEFTMNLRGRECTVFAEMLPPDPDTGVYGWRAEALTVIDAASIELMLTEQEEEQINEKCSAVAGENVDWDADWL